MDYRGMFDRDFIGAWDLQGRDVTVTISKVVAATLTAQGGRKSKKPVVFMDGTEKGFALNKTNAKCIASMYGNNTDNWIGKRVTLYPTQVGFGNETVDAIRVRPTVPKGKGQGIKSQPVDPAMRARQDHAAGRLNGEPPPLAEPAEEQGGNDHGA